ncbi:MAG: fumarylacetoacetate hydrolase family protein, partial [Candidatus Eremiobacteraeota bacterium]|nr:fumarylacetoacetate hydrolase family protein [Candidatus Eremiobacteraeota bacterium]
MAPKRADFLAGAAGAAGVAAARPVSAAMAMEQFPAGMRSLTYATIRVDGADRLAIKTEAGLVDVIAADNKARLGTPTTIEELAGGAGNAAGLVQLATMAKRGALPPGAVIPENKAVFGKLVSYPEKIVCVGLNYGAHAAELREKVPKTPELFNKYNTALNRHGGTIPVSTLKAEKFDYESELVIIMGRRADNVSEADALGYVLGYTTGNDFTARDLQFLNSQWLVGKSPNHFAPIGPYLVGADLIPNPQTLQIETYVNNETTPRQNMNTSEMVHSVAKIIAYTSQYITLQPADIIFSGTPPGVINGYP